MDSGRSLIYNKKSKVLRMEPCRTQSLTDSHLEKYSLVNTQNISVTKIVDSSSIQCVETKYGLRIQFLALAVMIHEVWLNA